jgi:DNA replication initiation complex subunit (GINS family)
MKRLELIANRSVEKEIIEALEEKITDFYYTLLPQISGRGKTKYRMGTATWPEMNFLLISYIDDANAVAAKAVVQEVKERFPREGIKLFVMETCGG